MKLVAYSLPGESRVRRGLVVQDGGIVEIPGDFRALGKNDLTGLTEYASAAATARLDEVRLHAPVPNPGKILCIGLNYADHAREFNLEVPAHPVLFSKYNNALVGHDAVILDEGVSQAIDYEAELAVVIGERAKKVREADALNYVAGYMAANDVTARDIQHGSSQWVHGKTLDTFCPLGPWLVTSDEVPDPHNLRISCRVNGETLQDSNTNQLIFKIPALVSYLSQGITLEPGDIILTGTPSGIGYTRNPKVLLKDGDVVEVEIEKVGLLRNRVRASF